MLPQFTGTGKWKVSKVAGQTLNCYCKCCGLLSASIADALQFVNILVSGIFHGHFTQRLAVNKPCLQIVRCLLWKQTTTQSIRNNNPLFDQQPLTLFNCPSQYLVARWWHLLSISLRTIPLVRHLFQRYNLRWSLKFACTFGDSNMMDSAGSSIADCRLSIGTADCGCINMLV